MVHRQSASLVFVVSAVLLSACGGGGSASGNLPDGQGLSGVVVDGYIQGATVCLDLNNNGVCDPGERTAVTTVGGFYSLNTDGLDEYALASAMLIVDIPATARDADDNGLTLAQAGKGATRLMAPVNLTTKSENVISPLTTLVAERMRSDGATHVMATEWIRSRLGLGPNDQINADFMAQGNDSSRERLSRAASRLFKVIGEELRRCAQRMNLDLTAIADADNATKYAHCAFMASYTVDTALTETDLSVLLNRDFDDSDEIDRLLQSVRLRIGQLLNPDRVRADVPTNTMLAADFPIGLNAFRDMGMTMACAADANCNSPVVYGIYLVASMRFNEGMLDTEDYYAVNQAEFVPNNFMPRSYWELKDSQWQPLDTELTIRLHGDGDFRITGGEYGSSGVAMSASGFDLQGVALNAAGLNRFSGEQKFPAGANGYLLGFRSNSKRYVLSGTPVTAQNQTPLSGNLPDAYPSSVPPTWTNALDTYAGMSMTFGPLVGDTGSVSFRDANVPDVVVPETGSYQFVTVDGQSILMITEVPASVLTALELLNPSASADYEAGVRTIFAVAPDGYLREGVYTPESTLRSPHLHLNRTALNAILQARGLCQVDANYGNINCPN
ncbi:MAG: hypothetical protein R3E87_11260 [Burkholderiaceae bacterium]